MSEHRETLDWRQIYSAALRVIRRGGIPLSDQEDLAQEAARKMLEAHPEGWTYTAKAAAYAAKTAHSVIQDYWRKVYAPGKISITGQDPDTQRAKSGSGSAVPGDYLRVSLALRTAIASLSEEQRRLIQGVLLARGAMADLARKRNVHRGTISRAYHKALLQMRKSLIQLCNEDAALAQLLAQRGFRIHPSSPTEQ